MVACNFDRRFAEAIRSGTKRQTIRRERKRGNAYIGCALQLYVGMRTWDCEKLIDAQCTSVEKILVDCLNGCTYLENRRLTRRQENELARADGFENAFEMYDFLKDQYENTGSYPIFEGILIKWGQIVSS